MLCRDRDSAVFQKSTLNDDDDDYDGDDHDDDTPLCDLTDVNIKSQETTIKTLFQTYGFRCLWRGVGKSLYQRSLV